MSAGFFLTATNKLGIPVASDSDHSTDYDSEEEREIVRRKRILAARKLANPLNKVFKDSKNKNSDLPNPLLEVDKAQPEHGLPNSKVNWNTFGEDAKKTGLVTRYTPPTSEQLEQRRKERENGRFEYNLASDSVRRNRRGLSAEEFKILHHGKERVLRVKKIIKETGSKARLEIEDEYEAIMNEEKKWKNRLSSDHPDFKRGVKTVNRGGKVGRGGKTDGKYKRKAPYQKNIYNKKANGSFHRTNFDRDEPESNDADQLQGEGDILPGFTMEDLLEPAGS